MRAIVDSVMMRSAEEEATEFSVEALIDAVGLQLAEYIETFCGNNHPTVLLLAGKGNNGADGYAALSHLLGKNHPCLAWQLLPHREGSMAHSRCMRFRKLGGRVVEGRQSPRLDGPLLIVDGIYGIGFSGPLDASVEETIQWANRQPAKILSIDLPSGVHPDTGVVLSYAIQAQHTFACHFPKRGCFLCDGWKHTGKLFLADLGLGKLSSDLYLAEPSDLPPLLPKLARTQNKYQAGMVAAWAGSPGMMGAASLATEAAYRVGAGYVKLVLFGPPSPELALLPREVVKLFLPDDKTSFSAAFSRADSVLVGPGLGRSAETQSRFEEAWQAISSPTVVDADGLFWLAKKPLAQWRGSKTVLTPHLGEAGLLLQRAADRVDGALLSSMNELAASSQSTIVLKGAPTFVFSQHAPGIVMPRGDPGMATAGSGDVLSGMIAGLLAQKVQPREAALLGSWLHGLAGEYAAQQWTSYGVMASSLLATLHLAFKELCVGRGDSFPPSAL